MIEVISAASHIASFLTQGLRDRPEQALDNLSASSDSPGRKREVSPVVSSFLNPDTQNQMANEDEIQEAITRAQDALNEVDPRVKLTVDRDLNRVVIKVVNSDSGEVIRQIPPEEMLRIQRFFHDRSGLLLKEEA